MFTSLRFGNFKVLRDAELPLGPFTLLVGPNGSGKSTALDGLRFVASQAGSAPRRSQVESQPPDPGGGDPYVGIVYGSGGQEESHVARVVWPLNAPAIPQWEYGQHAPVRAERVKGLLERVRVYSLNAARIAEPAVLRPDAQLGPDGGGLAAVLDLLCSTEPERFEALNEQVRRWLPEFERILLTVPDEGRKAVALRPVASRSAIAAGDLSQGTLLALALLTLAHLPVPPSIVGLEEPDRGIHPRLLRDVRDALYRLAYPADYGETREAVQVVATTHSPYLLDLFRDHPEEVVIACKEGRSATFRRLVDLPDVDAILSDSQLGEAWFSGVLGGVPVGS